MKNTHLRLLAALAVVLMAVVCLSACEARASALPPLASTATLSPTKTLTRTATPRPTNTPTRTATPKPTRTSTPRPTPTSAAGDVIPLKPLTGLSSLNATVKINVDGTLNGKPAQGDLSAQLTTNNQKKSQIAVTGSLLGDVIVQVGGSAVSLFRPSQVNIYQVPEGTYIVLKGLFDACIKPKDLNATAELNQLSPQSLMTMLTASDVARGKLIGNATLNGKPVKHYVIDGAAFLTAAQQSADPNVRTFGKALRSAQDADLYVDAAGGYPVAFRGSYNGAFEPLKFDGDFSVEIELTDVNANTPVSLPKSCNNPISR